MTGEELRNLRLAKEMAQQEVAEAVGIAPSTLQTYEYGKVTPKRSLLNQILEVLGEEVKTVGMYTVYLNKDEFDFLKDYVEYEATNADTVEAVKMYVHLLDKLEEAEQNRKK